MAGPDCLSRLLQENWMHPNARDDSWTTKDSYDEVPAFKELFDKLEKYDRDIAPEVTAGTTDGRPDHDGDPRSFF